MKLFKLSNHRLPCFLLAVLCGVFLNVAYVISSTAQVDIEWVPVNEGLEGDQVELLWQSPAGSYFAGGGRSGLFRSDALGEPWEPTPLIQGFTGRLTADSSGNIIAGTSHGVFISSDDGYSWESTNLDLPVYALAVTPNGNAFAGTPEGVYRRKKNTSFWELVGQWDMGDSCRFSNGPYSPICSMTVSEDSTLYVAVESMLYKTIMGDSWECGLTDSEGSCLSLRDPISGSANPVRSMQAVGNNLILSLNTLCDVVLYNAESGQVSAVNLAGAARGYSISDDSIVATVRGFAGGSCQVTGGLYRSDDEGITWERYAPGIAGVLTSAMAKDESWLCVGSGDGIDCSYDEGTSWWAWDSGLANTEVSSLLFTQSGSLLAGTLIGHYLPESSTTWLPLDIRWADGFSCALSPQTLAQAPTGTMFADNWTHIYKASEESQLWMAVPNERVSSMTRTVKQEKGVTSIATRPACSRIGRDMYKDKGCPYQSAKRNSNYLFIDNRIYRGNGGLSYSEDFFDTAYTLPAPNISPGYLSLAFTGDSTILAENFKLDLEGSQFYRMFPESIVVQDLVALQDSVVLAATNQGIFRSTDNGLSWQEAGPDSGCYNTLIATDSGYVIVDAKYISIDGGRTWNEMNSPPSGHVLSMATDEHEILYVGTFGWGVFRSSLPLKVGLDRTTTPTRSSVSLYPNPTRGELYADLSLEEPHLVTAILYDSLGRKKAFLLSQEFSSGRHQVKLDITGHPPGTYLVEMRTGAKRQYVPVNVF